MYGWFYVQKQQNTKKKQETCRWIYDFESYCSQAHLPHHLLNTSISQKPKMALKICCAN